MSKNLTIKEACELLGLSQTAVWYNIKKGYLKSYKAECGYCYMIEKKDVLEMIKKRDKKHSKNIEKREKILKMIM